MSFGDHLGVRWALRREPVIDADEHDVGEPHVARKLHSHLRDGVSFERPVRGIAREELAGSVPHERRAVVELSEVNVHVSHVDCVVGIDPR
jgi:hypothetical protein